MNIAQRSEAAMEALINAPKPGIKLSLDHLHGFFEALGNPQNDLPPTIHVAGTNGKGSTIAYLRAIYEAQGLKVHSYTSPHLVSFHERINLAGQHISDTHFLQLIEKVKSVLQQHPATFFEATTAIAFLAFQDVEADLLLLEVGMGGRLDTTNIIPQKLASVITPIGLDHTEFLGETLSEVAGEKAGIIKAGAPVFSARQGIEAGAVLRETAKRVGATWCDWQEDEIVANAASLQGNHQKQNAALAAMVARGLGEALPVSEAAIMHGIAHARWPARMQQLAAGPLVSAWRGKGGVLLDGAHNAAAAQALAQHVGAPSTVMCGLMQRKDVNAYLAALRPIASEFIAVDIPGMESQCMPAEQLAEAALAAGIESAVAVPFEFTADHIKNCASDTLVICGSLYLAGEILKTHR